MVRTGCRIPYCDGREAGTEAGHPLGTAPRVAYSGSVTGATRFSFVSYGGVEAANGKGELFGFYRMWEISGKPAQEIADDAKAWSQN